MIDYYLSRLLKSHVFRGNLNKIEKKPNSISDDYAIGFNLFELFFLDHV